MEDHQTGNEIPAQSDQGLEILKHAFSDGGKVIEFSKEDGEMTVADITEHHETLQEHYDQCQPQPTD